MNKFMGFKDNVAMINFFASTGKCNMKTLIDMLHITFKDKEPNLPLLTYKFLSGPFKGSRFQCTAPNTELMNRYPNFVVVFIDGPCAGLRTSSLITYDQKIESPKQWLKLLSNAPHI